MNFQLFDSHCHLQLPPYDGDRESVLGQMREQGIGAIAVGTNLKTSAAAVALAEAAPDVVWASIAVHPGHVHRPHHDASESTDPPSEEFFDENFFARLAASPKVVAIGETGLDYYRIEGDAERTLDEIKERQRENFRAHLEFARQKGLPLIMHIREAHEDALKILAESAAGLKGVAHCFTGTAGEAQRYLALGYYISFTGAITYPPKKGEAENALWGAARTVPLERLLIETDAPWLTPVPLRGKRNDSTQVRAVAEQIAKIRGLEFAEIAQITLKNAQKLFNLAA